MRSIASGLITFGIRPPPYSGFLAMGRSSRPVATMTAPTVTVTMRGSWVKSRQLVGHTFSHFAQNTQCSTSSTAFCGIALPCGM